MNYQKIVTEAIKYQRKNNKKLRNWIFPMNENNLDICLNNLAVEIIERLEKNKKIADKTDSQEVKHGN